MKQLIASTLLILGVGNADAYLAHHWHTTGAGGHYTLRNVVNTGAPSAFTYTGTTCFITDPAGDSFNTATAPNPAAAGQSICRMANKYVPAAGCAINVTTNMYVCGSEVNPASCTITGNQTRCN